MIERGPAHEPATVRRARGAPAPSRRETARPRAGLGRPDGTFPAVRRRNPEMER